MAQKPRYKNFRFSRVMRRFTNRYGGSYATEIRISV